jgi:farnesyl-diphosphate farnesyltransferase
MVTRAPLTEPELLALAQPVSRSFYLSLRFLPRSLRPGITLAYLLARASDTLADCANSPNSATAAQAILSNWADGCYTTPSSLPPLSCKPGEKILLAALPELLALLPLHPQSDLIKQVWQKILVGQQFDLHREIKQTSHLPLKPEDLQNYVYAVAGCVGEFWTLLADRNLAGVFRRPLPELLPLARSYGEALQWVNLIRDRQNDQKNSRIYLDSSTLPFAWDSLCKNLPAAQTYARSICRPGFFFPTMLPASLAQAMLPHLAPGSPPGFKLSRSALLPPLLKTLFEAATCPGRN